MNANRLAKMSVNELLSAPYPKGDLETYAKDLADVLVIESQKTNPPSDPNVAGNLMYLAFQMGRLIERA